MDEYVKWSVGPFWQQILGSNKQASFIKRAGEPATLFIILLIIGALCAITAPQDEPWPHDLLQGNDHQWEEK